MLIAAETLMVIIFCGQAVLGDAFQALNWFGVEKVGEDWFLYLECSIQIILNDLE